ncbi:MAG: hypothetical protein MUE50_14945, partial [Pirellulaceae bacterium]|nr:hypothetical protein [Pirellulaceae bacterium]
MANRFPFGRRVWFFTAAVVLFFCTLSQAAEPDFFLATNGNDQWSGKLPEPKADGSDGPLASFARAQQAVRQLKAAQADRDGAIIVSIRGGTYWLDSPITFGAEDSGTERTPVVYQAFGDERPIFSGGRPITGWKTDELGRWYADLPDVKDGQWRFCQLFVGDQRRFRPQLPK